MSRWADWYGITEEQAEDFLSASESDDADAAVMQLLDPFLAGTSKPIAHVEMDKAWEPIHRCLTGDDGARGELDFEIGEYPLNLAVLGGEQLLFEGHRTASLIDAVEVPEVADALRSVKKKWFKERFFELPDEQFHEINDEEFAWVWEHFTELPKFFRKVAKKDGGVICTVSH